MIPCLLAGIGQFQVTARGTEEANTIEDSGFTRLLSVKTRFALLLSISEYPRTTQPCRWVDEQQWVFNPVSVFTRMHLINLLSYIVIKGHVWMCPWLAQIVIPIIYYRFRYIRLGVFIPVCCDDLVADRKDNNGILAKSLFANMN